MRRPWPTGACRVKNKRHIRTTLLVINLERRHELFVLKVLRLALNQYGVGPTRLSYRLVGKVEGNILIYVQQDATLHSLFYLETALHVSGGTTTHHQERKQLYLQHLVFVAPLLLPAAMRQVAVTGATNTRCCRYSCLRS